MTTKQNPDFNFDEEPTVNPIFQFSRIAYWLKGVGFYYLIFIFLFDTLKSSSLSSLIPEERLESIAYATLIISSLYLPSILGKWLEFLALNFIKIMNGNQSSEANLKFRFYLSGILGFLLNGLALKEITLRNVQSYDIFFGYVGKIFNRITANINVIPLLIFTIVLFASYLIAYIWFDNNKSKVLLLNQKVFLPITLIAVAISSWKLFYLSKSLYHLNVVLFPLVTILNSSPSLPVVSDGFVSLYGGYFLWMQLPLKLFGANLLSIQILFCFLILLQTLMYFLISRCFISKQSVVILVFVSSIFWSYLFVRLLLQDMYFQYFPLRLLFPSLFILIAYTFRKNRRLQKKIVSINNTFAIKGYDILLIIIVSLAILNNLDSGLSTLGMYLALYGWDIFNNHRSRTISLTYFIILTIVSSSLVIFLSIIIFKLLSGNYPDISLYIFSSIKFGSGFFGLPFPDNLWMLFVLFYVFTLIQYSPPTLNPSQSKFKFSIAIWGLMSMPYFINRSYPYNLLHISFPFFLCCGFLLENCLDVGLELAQKDNQLNFRQIIQRLQSLEKDKLLYFSSPIVFLSPFFVACMISFLLFIPIVGRVLIPNIAIGGYPSSMDEIKYLSSHVNKLEAKLNRPSILISDIGESYFYLLGKRKVLFYPEVASIFDRSFEKRLAHTLAYYNPIVVLCPLSVTSPPVATIVEDLKKLLIKNQFQFSQSVHQCMIYLKN